MQIKEIFSELNGFVIYEPILLQEYLKNNQLTDKNVLNYLTETEYGDLITEEGIALPIIGLTSDYYAFKIIKESPLHYKVISEGWVLNVISAQIRIVGIGYFVDIEKIDDSNSISFSDIPNGWYKLSIVSYFDDENRKTFGLMLEKSINKPLFEGDMNTNYF
nr:hypothetical protein [uncultured Capnocytophaga sp.]